MSMFVSDIVDCFRLAGIDAGRAAYEAKVFIQNPYDYSVPEAFEAWADGYAIGVEQGKDQERALAILEGLAACGLDPFPANDNDPNFDIERYFGFTS